MPVAIITSCLRREGDECELCVRIHAQSPLLERDCAWDPDAIAIQLKLSDVCNEVGLPVRYIDSRSFLIPKHSRTVRLVALGYFQFFSQFGALW